MSKKVRNLCLMLSLGLITLVGCNPEAANDVTLDSSDDIASLSVFSDLEAGDSADVTKIHRHLLGKGSLPFHLKGMKGGKHGEGHHKGGRRGGKHGKGRHHRADSCVTITKSEGDAFPKTIEMVFDGECGAEDRRISGTVSVKLTAKRGTDGAQKIVTYKDLKLNGYTYNGVETTTFVSKGNVKSLLENGKVTTPDGKEVVWDFAKERKQTAGADTEDKSDDAFEMTGNTKGINPKGIAYSVNVTTPIVKSKDCDFPTKGVVESKIGENTIKLNYGDGTCDDQAVKTLNGEEETITLKKKKRGRHPHKH